MPSGVNINGRGNFNTFVGELKSLGMTITNSSAAYNLVVGYVPITELPALSTLPQTASVSPNYRAVLARATVSPNFVIRGNPAPPSHIYPVGVNTPYTVQLYDTHQALRTGRRPHLDVRRSRFYRDLRMRPFMLNHRSRPIAEEKHPILIPYATSIPCGRSRSSQRLPDRPTRYPWGQPLSVRPSSKLKNV